MMSYLWILLLGSLLAASAKAQDDTEEAAAAVTPAPEADAAPEANGESNADEKTLTDEEILPTQSAPISPPVAGADDAVEGVAEALTPAAEDAEAVNPAAEDAEAAVTPAAGDAEAVTPADEDAEAAATPAATPAAGDAEALTPAAGDAEVMNPADEDAEVAATTAAGDVEAAGDAEAVTTAVAADAGEEAAATTPEPVADPEPIANGEGEPEHLDSAQEGDAPTDPPAANNEEETTAPAVDLPDTFDLGDAVDDDTADNKRPGARAFGGDFNLEDALNTGDNNENPGISGPESGPHSAGAKDDNAGGKEAGSGSLAAILSTIGVAAVGAVTGYFTYQKKKLCFKNREEADPEAARKADAAEAQSDPQVLSNLLNSS